MDFNVTGQLFCICQILEKQQKYNEAGHEQFMDLMKACDSVRREVWYNILIEFDGTSKANKAMCLNENYSRVQVSRHFLLRMV